MFDLKIVNLMLLNVFLIVVYKLFVNENHLKKKQY